MRSTPSEQAIYLYLENRQLKGEGPATREEIMEALGFSESTLKRAFGRLKKKGLIEEARVETVRIRSEG